MTTNDSLRTFNLGNIISLSSNGDRRKYLARFVKAGRIIYSDRTDTNVEITGQALLAAAANGLFDAKAVFVDHAGFFDYPSLNSLVGVTMDAEFNPSNDSVEGFIQLYSTPSGQVIAQLLDDILSEGDQAPDVGLSMVFYPLWGKRDPDNPDTPRQITGIRYIESVDLVFAPAADGRVLQALSSHYITRSAPDLDPDIIYTWHRSSGSQSCTDCIDLDDQSHPGSYWLSKDLYPKSDKLQCDGNCNCSLTSRSQQHLGVIDMTDQLVEAPLEETPQQTPPAPSNPPAEIQLSFDQWMQQMAANVAAATIRASGLPQATQERLLQWTFASPADVQAAIESERAYLATLQEASVIQVGGTPPRSPQITGMRNSMDQIQLAFEALMEGIRPPDGIRPLTGIRELYHLLSGDYEMTGMFQPDRLQFANVSTSTMANLVANVLNKRVVNEFQQYPMWWETITLIDDFQSLQQVKWVTLGGVGELPTVAEGAAYTEMTWDDLGETASFVKKGGYLGITLEAIDKDDTGRVRAAPRALAQAAWLTLSKTISAIFTDASGAGPTMSDSIALFHASHSNVGTTALSMSSFNAARLAMRKQTELHSSERLGALTAPKFLLVPPDLEITALQIIASEYDYSYALSNGTAAPVNVHAEGNELQARMAIAKSRVVVVDLWTDTNDWAAVCDPRLYPTIGVGFRYGRVPEIFSVASPTAGLMFTNDTMPVKVRFFFAAGPQDYRGMYKANVA